MLATVKKFYFTSKSAISPDPEYNAVSAENILLQIYPTKFFRALIKPHTSVKDWKFRHNKVKFKI